MGLATRALWENVVELPADPGGKIVRKHMARRARPNGQQLFRRYPFYAVQEHQRRQLAEAIDQEDSEVIRTGGVDALAKEFAERFAVEAPRLIEGAISLDVEEARVDVTGDFRFGAFGDEPVHVAGIRAEYYVPYEGDEQLFQCSASTINHSMRPIELRNQELVFTYERPDQDVAASNAEFEQELAQVRQSLGWLANDCKTFNASLPAHARDLIAQRRKRLEEMTTQIQGLGVTIRKTATPTPAPARTVPPARRPRKEPREAEQYDIALSFAGENRAYVEEVATGLQAAGVKVFYDAFEAANLWGKNLVDHLAEIYANRARYVVMFISKSYVEKAWTTHEREHAQGRALVAKEEYILPARFDDTPVPGMTSTVAFQDLRYTAPQQLVELILAKLRRH